MTGVSFTQEVVEVVLSADNQPDVVLSVPAPVTVVVSPIAQPTAEVVGGSSDWADITNKPTEFPAAAHTHNTATTTTDGFMSAADKVKLDSLSTGGEEILNYADSVLTADVPLLANNTWYDGPSITLPPGTWKLDLTAHYRRNTTTACNVGIRAFDGTYVYAHGETYHPSVNGAQVQISTFGVADLTEFTTIRLQMLISSGSTAAFMKADTQNNPQGNMATRIMATRLA